VHYRTTGSMQVQARSRVHDVSTTWSKISADVDADPDAVEAAKATFTVDMTAFDAGDWLKNRKLRKDFALDDHPAATFTLDRVSEVVRDGAKFDANAEGTLRWRGKAVPLKLSGKGSLDATHLTASATFELDIKLLGLQAPKFFIVKMEDVVTVTVTLSGVAS
jgi:polyisoprenoid-binding protein YceI